jgi:predicted NAD/FAD-binding protein
MEKVAIIGSGIAGMAAAWLLNKEYDITIFEKNNYVGGHTNTIAVNENGREIPIDTGFIVFNKQNYPNLLKLFNTLNVPYKPTNMSFSVQHKPEKLEYNGSGFNGIFGQRRNLFRPRFYRMLSDIVRFNRESVAVLDEPKYNDYTISDYTSENRFGDDFMEKYLLPMNSAIWSTPPEKSLDFPMVALVRFFKNHGLLGVNSHFQWYTVENGSQAYKEKLIDSFRDKIITNAEIQSVQKLDGKVVVQSKAGKTRKFDKVLIAAHGDQALKMLTSPDQMQKELLSKFSYQPNKVTLHTDASVMPLRKRVWSAWNYRIEGKNGSYKTSTVYNMNILQGLPTNTDYLLSVNDPGNIDPGKVLMETWYDHPIFDIEAINAQPRLSELNNDGQIYFCGSYFGYGFHEDALKSGIAAAEKLAGKKLWN